MPIPLKYTYAYKNKVMLGDSIRAVGENFLGNREMRGILVEWYGSQFNLSEDKTKWTFNGLQSKYIICHTRVLLTEKV